MHHLTRLSLAYPKTAIAVLLAITAFLGAGLPNVRSEYGYRVLVGDDYPSIQALDALIEQFGGGLPLQIAWECSNGAPCSSVFDESSLRMVDAVTGALAESPGVRDVLSPTNAPLLMAQPDGFTVRRFVERGAVIEDAQSLAQLALRDPTWNGRIVSSDGRVGVVIVQPADTRSSTDVMVVDTIHRVLEPFERQGFTFHVVGDAAEAYLSGRDLSESSTRLIPFTVLVIGSVLLVFSRSLAQTLVVLATMGASLIWTFGLLGWLGWPRDSILEVLAPLLLVVGVCDSMHLLARIGDLRSEDSSRALHPEPLTVRRERVRRASDEVAGACTFTTLTDAAAFLSVSTSALDTFVRFGLISAFGVLAALVLTFSLLPLLLCAVSHGRSPVQSSSTRWSNAVENLARVSYRRARSILVVSTLALLAFGFAWMHLLEVDTDWLESWGDRSELTQSIRFVEQRLGSTRTIELRITLPKDSSFDDAVVIDSLQSIERSLAATDGVADTTSALDLIARMNRLVHSDDPRFERIPENAGATAELIELISLDDESVLSPWISIDRSQLRLSVKTRESTFTETQRFLDQIRQVLSNTLPSDWSIEFTGEVPTTVAYVRDLQATQLRGFPTAVLTVYLLLAVFLRSASLALAALLPTLLPIVMTLGTMGLLGLNLDIGRAMIGSIVIGIGVDDAIHLLSPYRIRRQAGHATYVAMKHAMHHSGRAIVTNSLALSLGFLTLMASAWQTISSFGFFVSLAIIGALISTLLVMPALIFSFYREDES